MRTIALASQKGGSGKTTLSGHLAVMAESQKAGPVALIDTDLQGSLTAWWNERKVETPILAKTDIKKLEKHIKALAKEGIKLVIIDTPPAVTETINLVLKISDLVIIPTRPSPHDLRAVGSTVDMAEKLKKKMIFVINGASAKAKITGEAAIALSQHGKVSPVVCFQRTEFASSMIDGRTVQEINPKGRSANEIKQLWTYVYTQLRKI